MLIYTFAIVKTQVILQTWDDLIKGQLFIIIDIEIINTFIIKEDKSFNITQDITSIKEEPCLMCYFTKNFSYNFFNNHQM